MGGILQKGLYSANVAYWDTMRSLATDYNNSQRTNATIVKMLNSDSLMQSEILKDTYLYPSFQYLLE